MSNLRLLVDRSDELTLLLEIATAKKHYQIVHIICPHGKGKTFLLKAFKKKCREFQIPCSYIEFAVDQALNPIFCMKCIVDNLGEEQFPEFTQKDFELTQQQTNVQIGGGSSESCVSMEGKFDKSDINTVAGHDNISIGTILINENALNNRREYIEHELTKKFIKELSLLTNHQPKERQVIIIFDAYETTPKSTSKWIEKFLLEPLRDDSLSNIVVVIAGCPEGTIPNFSPTNEWKHILIKLESLSPFKKQHIYTYFKDIRGFSLSESHLDAYYLACRNNPLIMGEIADTLEVDQWLT
jgi:hypothetical protein